MIALPMFRYLKPWVRLIYCVLSNNVFRESMKQLNLAVVMLAAVASSGLHAQSISSYDITNANLSGFGGWSHSFSGVVASIGGGLANYSNGSGTLNDGTVSASHVNNQLFAINSHASITLYLDGTYQVSGLALYGASNSGNFIPGTLTGATIGFGGQTVTLNSSAFGGNCASGLCSDVFSFSGTSLENVTGNIVTISNIQGGWNGYYNIAEITVSGVAVPAVPEPDALAFLLAGLAVVGMYGRKVRARN